MIPSRFLLQAGILAMLLLSACTSPPENIQPIEAFDLPRYLGKWHEIARLDHSFERGLGPVTAEYSMRDDGGVRVLNRGYNAQAGKWEEAEGKAYFVRNPDQGYLKVSFFGPFYGAYIIFELDPDYRYALISGPSKDYLWFLARSQEVPKALIKRFIAQAKALGFETDKLIFPSQH